MPSCNFTKTGEHGAHLLWHIAEPEEALLKASNLSALAQAAYQKIGHPRKRIEWLAARLALNTLLAQRGHEHATLQKDAWGRPYLTNSSLCLSIAHCFPFAFVAVDQQHPVGIDIQFPSKKLISVREKFLDHEEIRDSGNNLEKLCVYWCAKEAIYKAQGGINLSLRRDIRISAFIKKDQGTVWGEIASTPFVVHYSAYDGHVIAWTKAEKVKGGISASP